ncbi:sirohydrochlorin chelatase [Oscillatoriales cyanobacterium LEGE 11467]|uniref:Sirohydrochlorin chelatase n=1 Tax=Zarconia navalis LEGE 11467 TaxID=1828826 RepID=A0A928VX07_9CYAN|nr:sirohydrochlorin chelatase [Zarconia navalis]MBE9039811.1 sirohydrochlorin chelatase [Zarconia navalis LEGE 11467]
MDTPPDSTSAAYLLVTHGSRDPRPEVAAKALAKRVFKKLSDRSEAPLLVETAALELQPQPLHQQIQQFTDLAVGQNIRIVRVVPLFLLPGVHVMEDIPAEVELANRAIDNIYNVELSIQPHLGSHPGIIELLANGALDGVCESPKAQILLSHGSRRPGGNQPIEKITDRLHRRCQIPVVAAYWSVEPNAELRVCELVAAGCDRIRILPYFLFPGGITDAIAKQVDRLRNQFSQTALHLAQPIGVSDELAALVSDLADLNIGAA